MKKIALGLLMVGFLTGCTGSTDGNTASVTPDAAGDPSAATLASFGKCIDEAGAVFYGTEWCPHCKQQKAILGDAMQNVEYVDCDVNRLRCSKAGIQGYPTWTVEGGANLVGTQQVADLAAATGCEAPAV